MIETSHDKELSFAKSKQPWIPAKCRSLSLDIVLSEHQSEDSTPTIYNYKLTVIIILANLRWGAHEE